MPYVSLNAIILKKHKYSEYDEYVTIYSPLCGKIHAFAKGSRKITSHFLGHFELLNICNFRLYKKNNLFTVTQCQSQKTFKALYKDITKTVTALWLLEIFDKYTYEEQNNENLFHLLEKTLESIEKSKKPLFLVESFKIKFLDLLGMLPEIARCSSCNKKWHKENIITLEEGHLICENCQNIRKNEWSNSKNQNISFNMMKLIHFLKKEAYTDIEKIKLQPSEEQHLKKLSSFFFQGYINREIRSEKVINQMQLSSSLPL